MQVRKYTQINATIVLRNRVSYHTAAKKID